jgi:hypothetical protein
VLLHGLERVLADQRVGRRLVQVILLDETSHHVLGRLARPEARHLDLLRELSVRALEAGIHLFGVARDGQLNGAGIEVFSDGLHDG